MPLYLGERLGLVAMVVASREARKTPNKEKSAAYMTINNTAVHTHQAVHCWWKGRRPIGLFVREVQGQDKPEDPEGWRL